MGFRLRLELRNPVVVGLNCGLGGGNLLAGGGITSLRGGAVLRIVELAQLHIALLNATLLRQIGGGELGDLRQTLGRGHAGLGQTLGCGGAALSQVGGHLG